MELKTAVSYLVALAVPLWLVVEFMVRSRKSSRHPRVHRASDRLHPGPASKPSGAPARRLASSRKPA
jgi:hypothetical protein